MKLKYVNRMMLRKMSDSNELFLFEDRYLREFRVYKLINMTLTHRIKKSNEFVEKTAGSTK